MRRLGAQLRAAWAPWREAIAGLGDNPLPPYFRLLQQRRRARLGWRSGFLTLNIALWATVSYGCCIVGSLVVEHMDAYYRLPPRNGKSSMR